MSRISQWSTTISGIFLLLLGMVWVVNAAPDVADSRLSSPAGIDISVRSGLNDVIINWRLIEPLGDDLDRYELNRYNQTTNQNHMLVSRTLSSSYVDNNNIQIGNVYCYSLIAWSLSNEVIGRSSQACVTAGQLTITAPNQAVPPDSSNVPVAINLENGNGLCAVAVDIELTYDSSIVTPSLNEENEKGKVLATPFTDGWVFVANVDEIAYPGANDKIHISAITTANNCITLYGSGSLFDIYFDVLGNSGSVSPLDFVTGLNGTVIYDENNLLTPVALNLADGELRVQVDYIRGDVNGDTAVNSVDALLALMIASGQHTPSEEQTLACDVNGDTACNSADSSVILCFAAHQSWTECGLNGRALSKNGVKSDTSQAVDLKLGTIAGLRGEYVTVPFDIINAAEFAGGRFDVLYNPDELTLLEVRPRGLSSDFQLHINESQEGLVQVALASHTAIGSNNNGLFDLVFEIQDSNTPLVSEILLASAELNDRAGRDFVTSALQRTAEISSQPSSAFFLTYLPTILR